jgi:molybdopterin molybdotransferase
MSHAEFFNVLPVDSALQAVFEHWQVVRYAETMPTIQALGQVIFSSLHSPLALPEFRRSTMDGFAVRASDTFGASANLPAYLNLAGHIGMGEVPTYPLLPGQAMTIHTGGMLPQHADAVVMVEHTQTVNDAEVEVLRPVAPGENIIQIGEDVPLGAEILPAGHRLRPQDIGGLLAVGISEVRVVRQPRVGIISCGDELVPPDEALQPGQIRDINAHMLSALVRQHGGLPQIAGIARDQLESYLALALAIFPQVDVLVFTAGSSVSTRDLTRQVIETLGPPGVLQHGLAVKPGKPTILAVCDNKPVIGLPGNPVSAFMVAQQIIVPLIFHALGTSPPPPITCQARLSHNIASTTGRVDRIAVRLIQQKEEWLAEPVLGKSNLIFTLVKADGWIEIPLNSNGLQAGAEVTVVLFT